MQTTASQLDISVMLSKYFAIGAKTKIFLKCHCDKKNRRSEFKLNGRTCSNEPK